MLNSITNSTVVAQNIPYFTIVNSLVLFFVFIYEYTAWDFNFWTGEGLTAENIESWKLGIYYPNNVVNSGYFYQFMTYFLLHQSFIHLGSNLLMFVYISMVMERKYTFYIPLIVFLMGSLCGGLLFITYIKIWYESTRIILIGASAGCYALYGLLFADTIINYETIPDKIFRGVVCGIGLLAHILEMFLVNSYVAVFAHTGGLLFGIASVWFIPNYNVKCYEYIIKAFGLGLMLICLIICPIVIYSK